MPTRLVLWCFVLAVVFCTNSVTAVPWANPVLEHMDEIRDAQIYDAVLTSVKEWQERQLRKATASPTHHKREKREEPSVCYSEIGCFEASGPFGYLDMLPSPPEDISTKFLLYPSPKSRRSVGLSHAEVPSHNLTDAFAWAKQGFNKSLPTKVLIHGFGSDCTHVWVYELRSALMAVEEMNIICVDWSNGAELPNYVKAAANTRLVGKQLAILLNGLIEHAGIAAKTMHLIGFSLGAHVAGFAGAELRNLSRITGLDPAGPLFESQDPRARLDQTDALFVDVIHSNGENLILGGLGSWQPLGHVDFYPNGGRMQKGCTNLFVGAVSDIIWSSAIEGRSLCNHRRAYKFFTDSVSPRCHFPAFPCESYEHFLEGKCFPCNDDSCGNMGYYADRSSGRGQLYLITRDEEPFCAHQYHVKIESSGGDAPITSYGKIQITLVGDSELNETFVMTKKDDEEMKLGHSISRILVPHPILADLSKIQILYTAYSGWLSSGLQHWKIDRITLSDSFGKSSSICKKSLILQSGVPITLPLYPGQCNIPEDDYQETHIDIYDQNATDSKVSVKTSTKFIPTPVVKIGNEAIVDRNKNEQQKISFQDAFDIFSIPWQPFSNEKDNLVDDEKESSRALNTRPIVGDRLEFQQSHPDRPPYEYDREIVEPVLRPHSTSNNKIGRSHDPDRAISNERHEISEPILGPTTSRAHHTPVTEFRNKKEFTYNFYDSNFEDDWIPSATPKESSSVVHKSSDKWKRQDDSRVITGFKPKTQPPPPPPTLPPTPQPEVVEDSALNFITMTVQFLPQRIARMFEQAERYARETILPFVSAHAPKIIRDFIAPDVKQRYLPLRFEEPPSFPKSGESSNPTSLQKQRSPTYRSIAEKVITTTTSSPSSTTTVSTTTTTPLPPTTTIQSKETYIQKISRRPQQRRPPSRSDIVFEDNRSREVINYIFPHRTSSEREELKNSPPQATVVSTSRPNRSLPAQLEPTSRIPEIYIDLPVFDADYVASPKYIPLLHQTAHHRNREDNS